jgi:DNA-binding NarL/FixJ family response regulator
VEQVIRVAIVTPVMAMRAGLRAMLSAGFAPGSVVPAIDVIYETASLEDFEPFASQTYVLVVASEVASNPALKRLALRNEGGLAVLLLADDLQAAQELAGLPWRAWGVLPFDVSGEELQAAIHALSQGLLVGAPALMRPVLGRLLNAEAEEGEALVEALTERETQVLQLLAHGLANKQIAVQLGISEHTVKFHVSSIYTKLGATNRTEAVRKGLQRGLVLL